ncbi:MAG: DNA polymerase [Planctomycetia bacterium]|nr:DNA polymerase [Planctomycetia bacterium]
MIDTFREIWLADFEFSAPPGERPQPLCLVAREFRSGRLLRLWRDELHALRIPPFDTGRRTLFVAYYASAELGCYLSLDWPMPERILDLYVEFRNASNGLPTTCGNGLLGALVHYGLGGIEAAEKQEMRELAMRGNDYTDAEQVALLDYCQTDVDALAKLLPKMLPEIDLPRAILRGRYMAAAARMESAGVPIDVESLEQLRESWRSIQGQLIERIDADFGVYVPRGQKRIDPSTPAGAAVFTEAHHNELDPHHLAEALDYVWKRELDSRLEWERAKAAARRDTGLTVRKIEDWERRGGRHGRGGDHSDYPGLDVTAREIAGRYPELGIGPGYDGDDGRDYAALLWETLREPARPKPVKHDPELIARAVDLLRNNPGETDPAQAMTFSAERFARYLIAEDIPWPRLASGALALDDDTFRQMARTYAQVAPLRELRHSLGEMRLFSDLAVGADGRNRCLLSPFRSTTGRNQPSNAKFIFGPSVWLRGLIKPSPGQAVAYIDWSQQEFGIAAVLSDDPAMRHAYASGDPYLEFAKQAGLIPRDATKQSHPAERDRCKVCILATQYGMGPASLAQSLGQPEAYARELLDLHRAAYPRFWKWSQACVDHAMLRGSLWTVFGWRVHVGGKSNPRSLANFPMQANGAEMLRLACCLATERGITVCAPVHDAVLVEGADEEIDHVVAATQAVMREASATVLDGFELRSDAKIIRYPERYSDPRGERMWGEVSELLTQSNMLRNQQHLLV